MLIMKFMPIIILVFFVCSPLVGQATKAPLFIKDLSSFSKTDWSMIFSSDTSVFLGKKMQGQLLFRHKKDTTLSVGFWVFPKACIDSIFFDDLNKWLMAQNCRYERTDTSYFTDGPFRQCFYVLWPCHCSVVRSKPCQELADQIQHFLKE